MVHSRPVVGSVTWLQMVSQRTHDLHMSFLNSSTKCICKVEVFFFSRTGFTSFDGNGRVVHTKDFTLKLCCKLYFFCAKWDEDLAETNSKELFYGINLVEVPNMREKHFRTIWQNNPEEREGKGEREKGREGEKRYPTNWTHCVHHHITENPHLYSQQQPVKLQHGQFVVRFQFFVWMQIKGPQMKYCPCLCAFVWH